MALHPLFMGRCSIVFGNQTFASFSGFKYVAKILRAGSFQKILQQVFFYNQGILCRWGEDFFPERDACTFEQKVLFAKVGLSFKFAQIHPKSFIYFDIFNDFFPFRLISAVWNTRNFKTIILCMGNVTHDALNYAYVLEKLNLW